ncbi:hypothetical protein [Anabaena azotica]|uniref:Uncharacterized protein n=1 Tax=Anabaena azotica FACHB-119 TaxID=947527 RepID=A0ABR8CYM9_9NOST|nr:hypothetical protein [Anabaena azotica]MBD2500050.1 hypothetical protein [Anabaena azotica FACHB-119]
MTSYQHIVASLEPRAKQDLSNALPGFLRQLISATSQLIAQYGSDKNN